MKKRYQNYIDLLIELVKADIKLRYSGSILGFLWVFLKPFFTFLVIILVFSYFFNQHDPHYRFNVLYGLIFFNYFSEGTMRGLTSILDRSNLILKTRFPRYLTVVVSLLDSFVNFCAMLLVFFVFWLIYRSNEIDIINLKSILIFSSAIVITTILILAISFFTSIIFVRLRDVNAIWGLITQILMYFTPIIYPLSILSPDLQKIFVLNPLTIIIDYSRNLFLGTQSIVPVWYFVGVGIMAVIFLVIAIIFFKNNANKIAEFI